MEADDLPRFLPKQRWFAGKSRTIRSVAIVDQTATSLDLPLVRFVLIEVTYQSGRSETYFLPLGLATGPAAAALGQTAPHRVIGSIDAETLLYDALGDPEVGKALLDAIGDNESLVMQRGAIRGEATSAFGRVRGPKTEPLDARSASFEQSNSTIIFGDRLLMKVFRRLEPGINPDIEIGKFFADKTKFNRVPTTAGSLAYLPVGSKREPMMLGILQGLVANEGTGWDHALAELAAFYEAMTPDRVAAITQSRSPRSVRDQIQWDAGDEVRSLVGSYLADAARLGRRTAEMHLALASDRDDPAFRPEPLTSFDLMHLGSEIHHQAELVQAALKASSQSLPEATQGDVHQFLDGMKTLLRQVDAVGDQRIAAAKIRCHGDYHLGQVLRTGDDYILLDFEGEPAKSLPERLARQSALKDVAGMIRSFDYAAFAALFAHTQNKPERFNQLAGVAQFWRSWVASAFLREYLAISGDAVFIPKELATLAQLLEIQLLDKALYELLYELNNRPDWVRIPLQGINALNPSPANSSASASAAAITVSPQHEVTGLTDFDVYLLNEGTHYRAYDKLGAHVGTQGGKAGVQFAVWAPNASRVSVIGDFNGWQPDATPLNRRGNSGFWEGFVAGVEVGSSYKYSVTSGDGNRRIAKADPFAFSTEVRPRTASKIGDLDAYAWNDQQWMANRIGTNSLGAPISIYEVHLGSWMRSPDGQWLTYAQMAEKLGDYVHDLGFTHVELMPIAEHPFDGSWGYQVTAYFAPTSRFGIPQDFMAFVDHLHQRGIGVILDWVPAHFPTDEHALGDFDGTHLYEHADPRQGFHQDWNTYIFNFGRPEVANFLITNALFWLDKYHIDGLRVDAVASMLYRDYSRKPGEWVPNEHGGRENFEAITLLRRVNERVHADYPGVLTIAEESTAWPMVSRPTAVGGLGFDLKWDLGWMHDSLHYFHEDPINRKYHHNNLTFRGLYAFTENFILPLSHDEVVYGKGSLITKMPGDTWQKLANLRLLFGYMFAAPGKKLLFMGDEFGQGREWNHDAQLEWSLLDDRDHAGLKRWVRDLNTIYRGKPSLHELDTHPEGWRWINADDSEQSVLSFLRKGHSGPESVLFVANFTPVPRHNYRVGVPVAGQWEEVLNSDAPIYGGSGQGNIGGVATSPVSAHGHSQSLILTVPPLAIVALVSPSKA